MAEDSEGEEKKIGSEIELARKELEMDIDKREREAKAKLDEILSKGRMEFCSRCGKKIGSRIDWAGKCLWSRCENLVCRECWEIKKYRFCKPHSKGVFGPEEQARKKEFFEEEDAEIKLDLRAMLEEDDDSRKEKLKYLASEYARWLQKRMEKSGPIDWTPNEFLKKPGVKVDKLDSDYVITMWLKKWFRKKVKLSILITPFDSRGEPDANSTSAYLQKMSRKYKGYKLFVLVADGAKLDVITLVNKFNDTGFSLYMAEPKSGNLYFNINDAVTRGYSGWLNQKKEPENFEAKLKRLADLVSGRFVVSEKDAMKEFGFRENDVHGLLKSCPFLSHIKDTDTFFWKEE